MSMKDLENAFQLLEQHQGDFEGPKADAIIDKAEHVLGLKFPPTYRKFLSCFGCGDICGAEFFGVIHDNFENSGIPDAVWLTLNERNEGLPASFIIVAESGDGEYYVLDSSKKNENGEYPVLLFAMSDGSEVLFDDFGEFMWSTVENAIS